MKSRSLRPRTLAVAVAALVAASGLSADRSFAGSPVYTDDSGKANPNTVVGPSSVQGAPARYIVRFVEQPLAMYNSAVSSKPVNGIGAIPSKAGKNGRLRLDVKSSQAIAYVQYLKEQQQQHLSAINSALGQSLTPRYSMQHALNAVVVVLTPQEAAKVAKVAGVLAVNRDVPHPLSTDIGPGFIGASSVWWGAPAGQDTIFANAFESTAGFLGDGIVIGDIDTGYNSSSPSFQATDAHGYTIQNPLGTGNFLGQCGVAGISDAGCNDKVIGVYDEIELTSSGPPFSVEDTQGHGSHTASTAGGNFRSATFSGYVANISGVAPHANLIIYYACSPDPNVQCSTAATSASVDQAIQDGVVDALNYSISGGGDPWNDPTSQAFLSATDAGIFVAAAAGNTSASVPLPLPGTANHAEPWVATIAASTHTGGSIAPALTITGPGTVPANLISIPLTAGSGGVAATATFTGPIVLSPAFHNQDLTGSDGCTASGGYAAGIFTGATALVSRGTCSFSEKVTNATTAGAVAVIISDNRVEGPLTPSVPGTTVPAYTVLQSQGTDLQTFLAANSNTGAALIPYPPSRLPQQPDELANFSLLGPVAIDVIKPDVEAPGVNILAAIANDGTPGGADLVALYNGTSMATPHTTGSAGLMFGVHPEWSPSEAKSALMMTAKEAGLTKPDGTTPADFFDRGSGRLQDFVAIKAGLVLNETGLNFALADPGLGGDPSTLNIPSMFAHSCVSPGSASCSFQRKFHSTQDHAVTWTASVTSDAALAVTVTPSSFSVVPHGTRLVDFDVDATGTNADGVSHFAEIVLTPDDATLPPLHLPMAIVVPSPSISAAPSPLNINITSGTTGSGTLTVSNNGGPTLNVTNTNDTTTSNAKFVIIDQPSEGNNGYYSTNFTDQGPNGSYASDDFVVPVSGANLNRIIIPGFSTGTALTALTGHGVHFRVYGNAGGLPNGDPQGITSATPAVYSYNTTIGATGLSVAGNTINLDLVAAGAPASNLAAGTYWLVAYVDMAFGTDGGFAQFVTTAGQGNTGAEFGPVFGETSWGAITDAPGFAMHIEEQVPCGAAWLSATPSTLTIGPASSAPLTVNVDSTLFPGATGSANAFLCLDSNDPATPVLAVPVKATGGSVGPAAPTVAKAFAPTSVNTGANSTATITLTNSNASAATLTANLVDTLPASLVATAGTAATTCTGGAGASIAAGGGSVTLGSGAAIPASGSCTVSFTVTSSVAASYTNTIPVGGLQTSAGNNATAGSATLTVNSVACTQPIQDPGFEATAADLSGNPFWGSTSTNFGNAFCTSAFCGTGGSTANVHGGTVWVWLGGAGTLAETATASQSVVIPNGGPRFLNYYLWIGSVTAGVAANMDVKVDGTTVHSYPAPAAAEAGYTARSIDVSAFANGASHTILFNYVTPAGGNSSYSIDDVTLDCAALPAELPRPATNPPTGPTTRLVH